MLQQMMLGAVQLCQQALQGSTATCHNAPEADSEGVPAHNGSPVCEPCLCADRIQGSSRATGLTCQLAACTLPCRQAAALGLQAQKCVSAELGTQRASALANKETRVLSNTCIGKGSHRHGACGLSVSQYTTEPNICNLCLLPVLGQQYILALQAACVGLIDSTLGFSETL